MRPSSVARGSGCGLAQVQLVVPRRSRNRGQDVGRWRPGSHLELNGEGVHMCPRWVTQRISVLCQCMGTLTLCTSPHEHDKWSSSTEPGQLRGCSGDLGPTSCKERVDTAPPDSGGNHGVWWHCPLRREMGAPTDLERGEDAGGAHETGPSEKGMGSAWDVEGQWTCG